MKVIFLDIDGVLNCSKTPNPKQLPYIVDRGLLRRFVAVTRRTQAKVVLSSTWRYDPAGLWAAKHHGIRFIGCTPDLPGKSRCDEIKRWLKAHPRVKRFAILDDEDDGLDSLPLFQPSAKTGLTKEIATGLINYLNGKTEHDMRRPLLVRALRDVSAFVRGHPG